MEEGGKGRQENGDRYKREETMTGNRKERFYRIEQIQDFKSV